MVLRQSYRLYDLSDAPLDLLLLRLYEALGADTCIMIMNDGFVVIWKEEAVVYFKLVKSPGRDSKSRTLE